MTEAESKDDAIIAAAKSLPLPDRLLHSHWRVRSDAYADVVKEAGWAQDGSTQPLRDFGAVAAKVALDGNANALDSGLEALVAFLGKADEEYAQRYAPELAPNLVSKGLSARPKTVAKASEALLLLVGLAAAEPVVEALATGCQGKLPKGVAACVDVLLQALRAFGVRIIKPTPLMRCVASLVDHKDGAVREGAKEVAVELTRWLGPAAVKRDLTSKMREAQQKEARAHAAYKTYRRAMWPDVDANS